MYRSLTFRSLYPKNVVRFQIIRSLCPQNVIRFAHSPSLGWHPVGRMQYAPTRDLKKSIRFQGQSCTQSTSPASAEALIFFCLLFFHQGKAPTGAGKFFSVHFQNRSHIYLYSSIHFPTPTRTRLTSPASAEALIFFCLGKAPDFQIPRSIYPKNESRFRII